MVSNNRWILVAVLVLLSGCNLVRIDSPNTTPPADVATDPVRDFVRIMNRHRQQVGCDALVWDERVAAVAEKHSEEMARYQYMSHTNRAKQTPFARLEAAGIKYSNAAENVAAGQRTGAEVMASWRSSAGHRQNIEECNYTRHGVAMVNNYWTHMFIRPR